MFDSVVRQSLQDLFSCNFFFGNSGNRAFRSLVKDHQQKYLNAKKRDKPSVASKIVSLIREKGGRFLRRYDTDHTGQVRWVDIGDDRAREVSRCRAFPTEMS